MRRPNMGQFLEFVSSAVKNIKNNKMRSILTMLGIIIGIMSVIIVITLGDGMSKYVSDELNSLGGNYMQVSIDTSETSKMFTMEDVNAIRENVPNILGASPYFGAYGTVNSVRNSYDANITGCNEVYYYQTSNRITKGRYFTKEQVEGGSLVCVIKETDAKHLFGTTDVIGLTLDVTIGSYTGTFTIVGIYNDDEGIAAYAMSLEDYSTYIEMPYTTFENTFHMNVDEFSSFEIYAPQVYSKEVGKEAVSLLETRHGIRGEELISMFSFGDITDQIDSILSSITLFMSIVAAISLLVGGIGVMNIMLVSVTERTREIGIRKSIGARTSSILIQFLAEAAILTLMGGIIGIILGIIIAAIICNVLGFSVVVNPMVVIMACVFSSAVGLFFGIYPAKKAAKMTPIEALRK